jgi:phage terminase small subunit
MKGKRRDKGDLTIKQAKFCDEYIVNGGNASAAYRIAYSSSEMKSETVNVKASELLKKEKIAVRVKQLQSALQKRSEITKDEAVRELTNIVRVRITDILRAKGVEVTIVDINELAPEIVACISSIKATRVGIEVKLYDKIAAIDRLSKMLGWDEAVQVDIKGSLDIREWVKDRIKNNSD